MRDFYANRFGHLFGATGNGKVLTQWPDFCLDGNLIAICHIWFLNYFLYHDEPALLSSGKSLYSLGIFIGRLIWLK
jgi:hypothetical protein